jgi:hypothetical protein
MKITGLAVFILIQFCCLTNLDAQWADGYVIGQNNDTIFGKITNLSDDQLLKMVTFSDTIGNQTVYTPMDIKAFCITDDNRYFESHVIMTDSIGEALFLPCLIKGEVSFFLLRSKNYRYFVANEHDFAELINTKKEQEIDGRIYTSDNYEYIIILKTRFLTKCPALLMEIDKVGLNERDLSKICEKYNTCIHPEAPQKKFNKAKRIVRQEYRISLLTSWFYDSQGMENDILYGAGFKYSWNWPEFSKAFYLTIGMDLEFYYSKDQKGLMNYSQILISWPVYFSYVIQTRKVQPYVIAGFAPGFYWEKYESVEEGSPLYSYEWLEIPVGLGFRAGRFDFSATASWDRIQATLNYRLGK